MTSGIRKFKNQDGIVMCAYVDALYKIRSSLVMDKVMTDHAIVLLAVIYERPIEVVRANLKDMRA